MTVWPVPDWHDHDVRVYLGDACDRLDGLPTGSVQCVVTSPPYFGLRDYGHPEQIGNEPDVASYVASIVSVMRDVWRVLADDGVAWLNLGDSYAGKANGGESVGATRGHGRHVAIPKRHNTTADAPYKSLLMVPARCAIALTDDGWTLRNDVVWHKPNAMPESVRDRLSSRHESLYLLTKGPRYLFDLDAIKVPTTGMTPGNRAADLLQRGDTIGQHLAGGRRTGGNPGSTLLDVHQERNPGDVWSITTKPYRGAHFAAMPYDLARRCILAGTPDGHYRDNPDHVDVLDPFAGSGTTLQAARALGRDSVGIELNPEYLPLIVDRLGEPVLDFTP